MYCPNRDCPHVGASGEPAQYPAGVAECMECGSTLLEGRPAWPTDAMGFEEFVPVLTLEGAAMASFVQSLLQSAGIRFFVTGRAGTGFSPTIAPVVLVEPTKVDEAKELLAAIDDELEDDA